MRRVLTRHFILPLLLISAPVVAANPPSEWDGLVRVPSKKADAVYLAPNADFGGYNKVLLDPPEISFRKNWLRDQNDEPGKRVTNEEARTILQRAGDRFNTLFVEAYQKAGFQVVSEPGPDVLRMRTAVANLDVVAPDTLSAGRSWTFSREAGSATLILEARDSQTGALLGRALDARSTGDAGPYLRNSVTNGAEFENLFRQWAKLSANGLTELKQRSQGAGR